MGASPQARQLPTHLQGPKAPLVRLSILLTRMVTAFLYINTFCERCDKVSVQQRQDKLISPPNNFMRSWSRHRSRAEVAGCAGTGAAIPLSLWLRVSRCLRPPEPRADLRALAARGWCALLPLPAQLRLLQLVRHFLAQDAAAKGAWADPCDGARHYTPLQGGREAFTIRDACLPSALQRPARRAWRHAMQVSHAMLLQIEAAGAGPAGRLTELLERGPLPAASKSACLLRHFRCAPVEEPGAQAAVGAHADLGLLSFCLEDTAGLEVWDRLECSWRRPPPDEVIILAGEALCLITGGAFPPCRHRVIRGPRARTSQVCIPGGAGVLTLTLNLFIVCKAACDRRNAESERESPLGRELISACSVDAGWAHGLPMTLEPCV